MFKKITLVILGLVIASAGWSCDCNKPHTSANEQVKTDKNDQNPEDVAAKQ